MKNKARKDVVKTLQPYVEPIIDERIKQVVSKLSSRELQGLMVYLSHRVIQGKIAVVDF